MAQMAQFQAQQMLGQQSAQTALPVAPQMQKQEYINNNYNPTAKSAPNPDIVALQAQMSTLLGQVAELNNQNKVKESGFN
jgi:hypothetical protein